MHDAASIRSRLDRVRERIDSALNRSGRSGENVEVLAATKYFPAEEMGLLSRSGIDLVGENRAQELISKQELWGDAFNWDFIGHLQSRKVKVVLPRVRLVHSLCTESALDQIQRHAREETSVLTEVNLSGESSKSGLLELEVERFCERTSALSQVKITGLMTMPPDTDDPEASRRYFHALRELAQGLDKQWAPRFTFKTLSMGTSQDFEIAVEEGATIVRLGSVLWGRDG